MFKKLLSICLSALLTFGVFSVMTVNAEGLEAYMFYDDCHSLDNVYSLTNLEVVDDVIGDADYKNGGKMIGMTGDWLPFEIVYKIPDGRSFKSIYIECSLQNLNDIRPFVAYSEDGESYTDFSAVWTSDGRPGSGSNNAGWAIKYITNISADNDAIRYVKLYYNETNIQKYKFYLRKVSIITAGGEITEDSAADELDGSGASMYDISNFVVYDLLNAADAKAVATVPDKFTDSNLFGIKNLSQDAYVVYKAGENRVFTNAQVQNLAKDNASVLKLYASKDGDTYKLISDVPVFTYSTIDSDPDSTASDGYVGWNRLETTTGEFSQEDGYKYVKLLVPGGSVGGTLRFKLANVSFTTADISKGCVTGDVYTEEFDSEMYHISDFKNAKADGSSLEVSGSGYVTYKALPKRELKSIELISDSASVKLEAMDIKGNKIIWNKEITKDETGGTVIISSDIPDGAAYVKLSGEAVYTGITIETADAVGSEWTYIDGDTNLSAELSGEMIDILKSGCNVSFSIPVKNTGSGYQSAKAYLCVFEGDRMEMIEEFDADVENGDKITVTGSLEIEEVTENTSVTLFLWDDLDSMRALGTQKTFGSK